MVTLRKPTLEEIVESLETRREQGFIDMESQEGDVDYKPLYDFLIREGIALRHCVEPGSPYWLKLPNFMRAN